MFYHLTGEPKGDWKDSWRAMEDMQRKGKIRSLGVSNFYTEDLQELQNISTLPVSAVQNWFDPFHQDRKTREYCRNNTIRYIGFSTLGMSLLYLLQRERKTREYCRNNTIIYIEFSILGKSLLYLLHRDRNTILSGILHFLYLVRHIFCPVHTSHTL